MKKSQADVRSENVSDGLNRSLKNNKGVYFT